MHWLTIASAVHNNQVNQTVGTSPSQVLLGYDTALMPLEGTTSNNQSANDQIRIMMEKCAAATNAINCTAQKSIVIPSIQGRSTGVVRSHQPKNKASKDKTSPKAVWTIYSGKGNLVSGLPTLVTNVLVNS
jgi:hypothetical protein